MKRFSFPATIFLLISGLMCIAAPSRAVFAQQQNADSSAASQMTPEMDGGAGPCSLLLTVSHEGKPAVAAHVKVHIAYGFGGVRKLDLDAYTGNDGKLKFTGLPARVKRPPLEFRASKDKLAGIATYDPESECHEKLDIVLSPKKSEE